MEKVDELFHIGSIENLKKIKNLFQKLLEESQLSMSPEEYSLILLINNFLFSEKYIMTMFRSQGSSARGEFCAVSEKIFKKNRNINSNWKIRENERESGINFEDFSMNKVLEICSKSIN
jgi:hypothetical protein